MKFLLATIATFAATPAFAHVGHTNLVAGHTHSLFELSAFAGAVALMAIAATVAAVRAQR